MDDCSRPVSQSVSQHCLTMQSMVHTDDRLVDGRTLVIKLIKAILNAQSRQSVLA